MLGVGIFRSGIDRVGMLTSWVFGLRIYSSGLLRVWVYHRVGNLLLRSGVVFKVSGWNSRRTLRFRGS